MYHPPHGFLRRAKPETACREHDRRGTAGSVFRHCDMCRTRAVAQVSRSRTNACAHAHRQETIRTRQRHRQPRDRASPGETSCGGMATSGDSTTLTLDGTISRSWPATETGAPVSRPGYAPAVPRCPRRGPGDGRRTGSASPADGDMILARGNQYAGTVMATVRVEDHRRRPSHGLGGGAASRRGSPRGRSPTGARSCTPNPRTAIRSD